MANTNRPGSFSGAVWALFFFTTIGFANDLKVLGVEDIMHFRGISEATINDDGTWVTYLSKPDRGDGEAVAVRISDKKMFRVERGSQIAVSADGKWIAALVKPSVIELEKAGKDKKKKEKLTARLVVIRVKGNKRETIEKVKSFAFSHGGKWLAIHKAFVAEKANEEKAAEGSEKKKPKAGKKPPGTTLHLRQLGTDNSKTIDHVASYEFAPKKPFLAYVVAEEEGNGNAIFGLSLLSAETNGNRLLAGKHFSFPKMAFSENGNRLAFLVGEPEAPEPEEADSQETAEESKAPSKKPTINARHSLHWVQTDSLKTQTLDTSRANYYVAKTTNLGWSKDEKRLFFGFKPDVDIKTKKEKPKAFSEENYWSPERILADTGLDVWHGDDLFIKTYDKTNWKRLSRQDHLAVYHLDQNTWTALADSVVPFARATNHQHTITLTSDLPYRRASTWTGQVRDLWYGDLADGTKYKIAEGIKTSTRGEESPNGRYVVFYKEGHYHLYDHQNQTTQNLTQDLPVPMENEDYDYPRAVPGYGVAGWMNDNSAFFLYDKFDIWVMPIDGRKPFMLTDGDGRKRNVIYRMVRTNPDQEAFEPNQSLLLSAYYDLEKLSGFYAANTSQKGVRLLVEGKKRFRFIAKAKDANRMLFTREDFKEFPDLWVADLNLKKPKKLTDENPQIKDFAWGTPELVSWSSTDGTPMQGVLIKPANYQPGKKYPVLVYYYRFFSQRMYHFNQMAVNHRPNFPLYTSNGYAVFLPDIRFQIGLPGPAAVKCLVPGVQKIIDMGIADPDAIGLHGHSWSGYQTAFVITQTNIFKAAVAGAPVSNMTSAYSGIRLGSGLARQFQYEKTQSRIGGSMWEKRDLYIENSPVFFADRIETPLLIQFGDIDEAVPWQQGIELYLAMRRLDKDVVFLQYRDEPHHLKKYPNKLDYTLKMKEYFDHYLKGEPAKEWITKGVPYKGK